MNLFIYLFPFFLLNFFNPVDDDCTCKGILLQGDVRVVSGAADLDVRVVEGLADLDVRAVTGITNSCGEWHFVDGQADFTIRYVDGQADLEIRFVSGTPGIY